MLIGITGKKRAGKDTVAARLVEAHGFTRVAFADPLKRAALDIDPLVRVEQDEVHLLTGGGNRRDAVDWRLSALIEFIGWENAKEIREVRRFLQHLGVAVRDHVDQDAWVNAGVAQALRLRDEGKSVVITDVRFPNELNAIHDDLGGFHLHIERPGLVSTDTHASETALEPYYDDAHAMVANSGSIEDLNTLVDQLVFTLTP